MLYLLYFVPKAQRSQTTGWIATKFGMVPVGNLEILFWADPPGGG